MRQEQRKSDVKSIRARIDQLRRAGLIAWSGRRLRPIKPVGRVRGNRSVADLISENRD